MKDYANFEMLVDWKIEKTGDSGIYLRGSPQVQIWDADEPLAVETRARNGLRRAVEQREALAISAPAG